MASLRKSKPFTPDAQTVKFLYTIIKQLDLKSVDWNEVAYSLDITNGHAARMRYSRFKQHIEGIPSQPRAPRPKKNSEKSSKEKPNMKREREYNMIKLENTKFGNEQEEKRIKLEEGRFFSAPAASPTNFAHHDFTSMPIKSELYNKFPPQVTQPGLPGMPLYYMSAPTTPAQVYAAAAAADNAAHFPLAPARSTVSMADLQVPNPSATSHNHGFMYPAAQSVPTTHMQYGETTSIPTQQEQRDNQARRVPIGGSSYDVPHTPLPPQPQFVQATNNHLLGHGDASGAIGSAQVNHTGAGGQEQLGTSLNSILIEDDAVKIKTETYDIS